MLKEQIVEIDGVTVGVTDGVLVILGVGVTLGVLVGVGVVLGVRVTVGVGVTLGAGNSTATILNAQTHVPSVTVGVGATPEPTRPQDATNQGYRTVDTDE
jgi:hypothetical protein